MKAHPKLVQRVKPFCELPEREVVLYAYLKQIDYQEGPCPYAGSALRNDVRTMLNRMEEKHPGTKFAIFRSIERIRPALEAAREAVELRECRICGEPTVGETCKPCQMLQELRAPWDRRGKYFTITLLSTRNGSHFWPSSLTKKYLNIWKGARYESRISNPLASTLLATTCDPPKN